MSGYPTIGLSKDLGQLIRLTVPARPKGPRVALNVDSGQSWVQLKNNWIFGSGFGLYNISTELTDLTELLKQ